MLGANTTGAEGLHSSDGSQRRRLQVCSEASPCACDPLATGKSGCNAVCDIVQPDQIDWRTYDYGNRCEPQQHEGGEMLFLMTEAMHPCSEDDPETDVAGGAPRAGGPRGFWTPPGHPLTSFHTALAGGIRRPIVGGIRPSDPLTLRSTGRWRELR